MICRKSMPMGKSYSMTCYTHPPTLHPIYLLQRSWWFSVYKPRIDKTLQIHADGCVPYRDILHASILSHLNFFTSRGYWFSVLYHTLLKPWRICVDGYTLYRSILHAPIHSTQLSSFRVWWFSAMNHTQMRSCTIFANGCAPYRRTLHASVLSQPYFF